MIKLGITIAALLCSLATFAQPRQTYSFNADWKIHVGDIEEAQQPAFDDEEWRAVTLPYAWNEDEAFAKPIHEHSTAVVWYRKTFVLPDDVPQEKVFLEFEGVRFGAEFYLNGTWIGRHENGVMAAGLDISQHVLRKGENTIAIRTDNDWRYREKATNSTFQWNDRNFNANYGGIPKNVWIHFTGGTYQTLPLYSNLGTTGVYVYAKNIDISKKRLNLHVESEVKNETSTASKGQFIVEVQDAYGKMVQTFEYPFSLAAGAKGTIRAQSTLENVNFW